MTTTINGTTGINLVQDAVVQTATLANAAVTAPKMSGAQTGAPPVYGCRAWCTFNGTTGALISGAGVSGVVRNATGNYTVTLSVAMPDVLYAVIATAVQGATGYIATSLTHVVGSFVVATFGQAGTAQDVTAIHIMIMR